jgi:flagellar basal-body rod protein FlgG
MEAQQLNLDVVSNNLANVNTAGFKKGRADFQDLLYQTMRAAGSTVATGAQVPNGIQVGLGTRTAAVSRNFSQGDFQQTGNPLDMVIEGDGFFAVLQPDGQTGYTRDGAFKTDSQGRVVTSDGYPLQPEITVPADAVDISVGKDGTVSVTLAGQTQPQELGKIQVARFLNPAGLAAQGGNLYRPTAASGDPALGTPGVNGFGSIGSKYVELSNVKVVEEMVHMIVAQRAYEINSKAIQAADEMLNVANNLRR